MPYKLKIPARVNILGNPSDANEGDFATISAAVDIYAYALVEEADQITIEQLEHGENGLTTISRLSFNTEAIPLPYDGNLDLVKGGINRLYRFSPEFREKLIHRGFKITIWTDVPRQSGLGGSSLFILLTLGGLRAFYNLDPRIHNDYVLAELTQRIEAKELMITCGYADRYVPLFGGLGYLDYRGKLHQKSVHDEPYVTYERLDTWVNDIPLLAVSSGVQRDSGNVHGQMRPRYVEEYDAWMAQGGEMPPMVKFMSKAWETAWRGKIALLQHDWITFGALMNQNHQTVDTMMSYCGFEDGAGWANNLLIEAALKNNALGAKLTGAGGGGSVFALSRNGEMESLHAAWERAIEQADLKNAQIYRPRIVHSGLVVENLEEDLLQKGT
jgi:galactokinase